MKFYGLQPKQHFLIAIYRRVIKMFFLPKKYEIQSFFAEKHMSEERKIVLYFIFCPFVCVFKILGDSVDDHLLQFSTTKKKFYLKKSN